MKNINYTLRNRTLFCGFLGAFLLLVSWNCNTTKSNGGNETPSGPQLGDVLMIKNVEKTSISSEDLHLRIDKVAESRCPKGVQCIQAGEGKLDLLVIKGSHNFTVSLKAKGNCFDTDGSCGNTTSAEGYTFSLMQLTPYPGEDSKPYVKQEDYVAHVKVEKQN